MVRVTDNADLQRLTTFGVPYHCGKLIEYTSTDDLASLFAAGTLKDAFHLGGGSNVLFLGDRNLTVLRSLMTDVSMTPLDDGDTVEVKAQSGVTLDDLIAQTCEAGLWGLENLSLIPGQVGGAAVQNVGAYGSELADCVKEVTAFDTREGVLNRFKRDELNYGYRHSMFKEQPGRYIVTDVTFTLHRHGKPNISYRALADYADAASPSVMREAVIAIRDAKLPDPAKTGSAGSYFVNPTVDAEVAEQLRRQYPEAPAYPTADGKVKLSAAWLIDNAGCKSMTTGGAALWQSQPLVLVNATGDAQAHDILGLEEAVRHRVGKKFGVYLACEVVKI